MNGVGSTEGSPLRSRCTPATSRRCTGEREVDGGVRGTSRLTEPAPDALVAAGRARLAEVREAQARHVGQEHDVRGDHHRRLAGAVGALERGHVPVEQVALVEHALPVHEDEGLGARAAHGAGSSSSARLLVVGLGSRSASSSSDLAASHQPLERGARVLEAAHRLGEAHQRRAQPQARVVDDVDEAEVREPAQRLADLRAHGLGGDALVVLALARGFERAHEDSVPSRPDEALEQDLARRRRPPCWSVAGSR